MPFYRYVSAGEHAAVLANHMRVPNVNQFGVPRTVYFTDARFVSAAKAEAALQIGTLNPHGTTPPPCHRLDLDLTGCTYSGPSPIVGGTADEYQTADSPFVTAVHGMKP
jgi:hypothetical protein